MFKKRFNGGGVSLPRCMQQRGGVLGCVPDADKGPVAQLPPPAAAHPHTLCPAPACGDPPTPQILPTFPPTTYILACQQPSFFFPFVVVVSLVPMYPQVTSDKGRPKKLKKSLTASTCLVLPRHQVPKLGRHPVYKISICYFVRNLVEFNNL